ncbi:MAG: 16S rRNA (cytosine(1402)-N(4))-methyltransferase RsmH [Candidatus Levyibacteriota bacterium]|nr:MAG: 16S rRNA (cytosine(1402)-N(4))-methyltransferase RsmH [Candidatus Levybacteria bacterium]
METYHIPVLLQEVISYLNPHNGKKYIDATLGGGGHTGEILRRGGIVLGIDIDQDAIKYVQENLKNLKQLTLARGNFRNIGEIARLHGFNRVSGILFDLGVSSHQFDTAERGFSFQKDAPLDMRMDSLGASGQVRASDLVNALTKGELYELFRKLGEERCAWAISESIVCARKIKPIETTKELADIVVKAMPRKIFSGIHPATKAFQALRMAVNDELGNITAALPQAFDLLEKNGRLLVISFHSLEDRIVKNIFLDLKKKSQGIIFTKKPIAPIEKEILANKRSRSAKLRVIEKL